MTEDSSRATFFANAPYDYRDLNISDTLEATGYEFDDNVFATYNGIVYEDLFSVEFDFGASYTTFAGDTIADFRRGTDHIDLRTIDANVSLGGNQAFTGFIGAARSFTTPGQLRFSDDVLFGNTDHDAGAEFAIRVVGVAGLSAADLLL